MPLPGSRLWERLGGSDDGRDWTHENEITFVFGSDIDETWLRRRIDETMAAFAAKRTSAAERRAVHGRQRRRRNSASAGACVSRAAAGPKRPSRRRSTNCPRPVRIAKRILAAEKSPSNVNCWFSSEAAVGPRLARDAALHPLAQARCPAAGTASRDRGSRAAATRRSAASRSTVSSVSPG